MGTVLASVNVKLPVASVTPEPMNFSVSYAASVCYSSNSAP